ncbi:MAG: TIGR03086 family protein [Actinomycetia bacterium]|nr:TIGR03086 family protein [Actinomycetes bacterium]MCP4228053.1 TIGR03086 family protein [Actinomycetes bacterium]MCP5034619.1 TIGR03086 family protein [Actinomycetes bacterium]
MEPLDALSRSRQEFEDRLRQIGDDQWNLSTPCTKWSVGDLVNHMLLGTRMSVQLLAGGSQEDVMAGLGDDIVGTSTDVVGDFVALADQMHEGFAAPGGLDGIVDHPMGTIPRTMFIGFRIGDNGVHAWDLARAIGADEQLDADLVRFIWDGFEPTASGLVQSGLFGDGSSKNVSDDAPLQTRLLDLLGRRP